MHNRLKPTDTSREIVLPEFVAIVPIVLVILALAFYPQFGLQRSEATVNATVGPLQAPATPAQVARR
jgi:NADH:ubiquinone oxidoreductase subunit 4 (subunit M)